MAEKTITTLVAEYIDARVMNFLDESKLTALFIEAAAEVYGWGDLNNHNRHYQADSNGCMELVAESIAITADFKLDESDCAIILPFAHLKAEKETALLLEASKNHGLEQHGRQSAEIELEISNYREMLHKKTFYVEPITI
ncbi:hypothetical protein LVJ82_17295 [Vitreoscilla massiliensis]|uniref:Uncharacterized protein n=1 Tax=Vitreoscilla massiliensis TaxID=1689272 RepID=A0ABY4E0C4_9NEIS|nr:hypothetical protein [Vitreoscilla massiliensis]UOO89176.1 hypothetical protein LVJ82_17295 [Vitreoscilla massiliensis]